MPGRLLASVLHRHATHLTHRSTPTPPLPRPLSTSHVLEEKEEVLTAVKGCLVNTFYSYGDSQGKSERRMRLRSPVHTHTNVRTRARAHPHTPKYMQAYRQTNARPRAHTHTHSLSLSLSLVKHPKLPPWLNKDIKETMAERDKQKREKKFPEYKKLRN